MPLSVLFLSKSNRSLAWDSSPSKPSLSHFCYEPEPGVQHSREYLYCLEICRAKYQLEENDLIMYIFTFNDQFVSSLETFIFC